MNSLRVQRNYVIKNEQCYAVFVLFNSIESTQLALKRNKAVEILFNVGLKLDQSFLSNQLVIIRNPFKIVSSFVRFFLEKFINYELYSKYLYFTFVCIGNLVILKTICIHSKMNSDTLPNSSQLRIYNGKLDCVRTWC